MLLSLCPMTLDVVSRNGENKYKITIVFKQIMKFICNRIIIIVKYK